MPESAAAREWHRVIRASRGVPTFYGPLSSPTPPNPVFLPGHPAHGGFDELGSWNTADGVDALQDNVGGNYDTAVGGRL